MTVFFVTLLNLSITASYIALAAIILRLFMKKTPKWICCLLWALVAVRLLLPFSLESRLSLVPDTAPIQLQSTAPKDTSKAEDTISNDTITQITPDANADTSDSPATPITPNSDASEIIVQDTTEVNTPATVTDTPVNQKGNSQLLTILSYVWLGGAVSMFVYSVASYLHIRRKVKVSISTDKSIYICDDINTPFILGFVKPRIYLPSALTEDETHHIIAHERAHLKRRDHLWKPIGFLLLTLHWFNPFLWLCYILLCRDIELACDEKVLKQIGTEHKRDYSSTLLGCSVPRRMVAASPLAFGEVSIKSRIKNIVNYKKPAFWVSVLAIILCVAISVCFLTNPVSKENSENTDDTTEETTTSTTEDIIIKLDTDNAEIAQNGHVEFDLDNDGVDEFFSVAESSTSHNGETSLNLLIWELALDNTEIEYIEIPDVTIDTYRNTATNFYLKKAGEKLYLFIEKNLGSRVIYELCFENGTISTSYDTMLIDIIDFDIDGDSIEETLSLSHIYTYTSQGCPFSISIEEHELKEYYNHFDLPVSNLGLRFEAEGDKLYLNTITLDALALQCKYEIAIEDGQIILINDGEKIGYYESEYELNNISSFSFESVLDYYNIDLNKTYSGAGVKTKDFQNSNEAYKVTTPELALYLAEYEVTVTYNDVAVSYDKDAEIWQVSFSTKDTLGGNQTVYLNSKGKTMLCIWGE